MMRSDHSWQRPCASPLSLVVEGKEGWEKARTHGHNEPSELLLYWKLKVKRGICNAALGPVKPFLDSLHTSQKLGRVKLEQLYCPSRNMSGSLAVSGAVCVCCLLVLPSISKLVSLLHSHIRRQHVSIEVSPEKLKSSLRFPQFRVHILMLWKEEDSEKTYWKVLTPA